MDKDQFLLTDRIAQVKSSFVKDGWLTIYESGGILADQFLICCYLIDPKKYKNYKEEKEWQITPGYEGKPAIITTFSKGKELTKYYSTDIKGVEPFLYSKQFSIGNDSKHYVDIAEEFLLYFKLYEEGSNKQNRNFYFVDETGDLEDVITIDASKVKVKLKYLMEYISVRKLCFIICFDFMRFCKNTFENLAIKPQDEDYQTDKFYYNHFIRSIEFIEAGNLQSWVRGKVFLDYDPQRSKSFYLNRPNKYEEFITGYDEAGNEIYESCERTDAKYFKLTFFKKEVLNKYYNDPNKYKVDGWTVMSNHFSLKIDNNVESYIPVFLVELSTLPHKEQLHWKHFNIPPQKGISHAYYQTMIQGEWIEHPETPDLYFKHKYEEFNEKWKEKFGWNFYKPLSPQDQHYFTALHVPTTNNVKAFCEQILSIVKLTVDRLNEAEFSKSIQLDEKDRGITKLEKFLQAQGKPIPDMILFLRNLQNLRSGLIAHSFSNSNKDCKRALEYFGLNQNNYNDVAREIFVKSIYSLNTLEKIFLTKQ